MLDYDFTWTQQPQAVKKLEYYLWQLGVVQGFHHSIAESVGQIETVQNILVAQVQEVRFMGVISAAYKLETLIADFHCTAGTRSTA